MAQSGGAPDFRAWPGRDRHVMSAVMPFDLYISRADTFGGMQREPVPRPRPRLLARMFPRPADPARITGEEFHAVLRGAPATRQGDHAYWVLYPDGDPWFVAEWRPEGNVVLSTSYSNHRFLRNFA